MRGCGGPLRAGAGHEDHRAEHHESADHLRQRDPRDDNDPAGADESPNAADPLIAIDRNPNDGKLYGVGSTSRVYEINEATNVATQVGPVLSELLTPTVNGVGFDFDSLGYARIVTDSDQNIIWFPSGFDTVKPIWIS